MRSIRFAKDPKHFLYGSKGHDHEIHKLLRTTSREKFERILARDPELAARVARADAEKVKAFALAALKEGWGSDERLIFQRPTPTGVVRYFTKEMSGTVLEVRTFLHNDGYLDVTEVIVR